MRLGSASLPTHSIRYSSAFFMARSRRPRISSYPSTRESKIVAVSSAVRADELFGRRGTTQRQSQRRQNGSRSSRSSSCSRIVAGEVFQEAAAGRLDDRPAAAQRLVELHQRLDQRPGGAAAGFGFLGLDARGTRRPPAAWPPATCSVRSARPRELLVCNFTSCRRAVNSSTNCSNPTVPASAAPRQPPPRPAARRLRARVSSSHCRNRSSARLSSEGHRSLRLRQGKQSCVGSRAVRSRRRQSAMMPAIASPLFQIEQLRLQPHHRIAQLFISVVDFRETFARAVGRVLADQLQIAAANVGLARASRVRDPENCIGDRSAMGVRWVRFTV